MRAVAYCRVSTNKEEQLDSMETQQKFFAEYAVRNRYELIHIYADEGKSGTKMKNRTQLLKLLRDAEKECFDIVLIKDISRLARNTVDFLTSIRRLKALNIRVIFVNYDQTSSDSSEFMLTMLSAIAQEESANTSKRVRFGKKQNAVHGKVPNLVFGYDKKNGDYFNLTINQEEAEIVKRIFKMYVKRNMGAGCIAETLNKEGYVTKRGCQWTQNGICRILANEIYIGNIVNGKEEIADFLTGKRKRVEPKNWITVRKPELRIIDDETFYRAKELRNGRKKKKEGTKLAEIMLTGTESSYEKLSAEKFTMENFPLEKRVGKYSLSGLIMCKNCSAFYRRLERNYKNTSVKWVCNGRNSKGAAYCSNKTNIDEAKFLEIINQYFISILKDKDFIIQGLIKEIVLKDKGILNDQSSCEEAYRARLAALRKEKEKYMAMYTGDIITMEELKQKTAYIKEETINYTLELEVFLTKEKSLINHRENQEFFLSLEKFLRYLISSHRILGLLLQKIVVEEGDVHVYLKSFSRK